jgi:hypothetical protein
MFLLTYKIYVDIKTEDLPMNNYDNDGNLIFVNQMGDFIVKKVNIILTENSDNSEHLENDAGGKIRILEIDNLRRDITKNLTEYASRKGILAAAYYGNPRNFIFSEVPYKSGVKAFLINSTEMIRNTKILNFNPQDYIFGTTCEKRGTNANATLEKLATFPVPKATTVYNLHDPQNRSPYRQNIGDRLKFMDRTSVEAVMDLYYDGNHDKKIGLFNFANFYNPGGGFLVDKDAQEEDICRKTNLYSSLSSIALRYKYKGDFKIKSLNILRRFRRYAAYWGNDNQSYSGDLGSVWVTRDVRVLDAPDVMFNIYSGAAMQFRNKDGTNWDNRNKETAKKFHINKKYNLGISEFANSDAVRKVHRMIIYNIISAMADDGVKVAVLGAFGSGAFNNHPVPMAELFLDILQHHPRALSFDQFVFAIPSDLKTVGKDYDQIKSMKEGLKRNMDAYMNVFRKEYRGLQWRVREDINPYDPYIPNIAQEYYPGDAEYTIHKLAAIGMKKVNYIKCVDSYFINDSFFKKDGEDIIVLFYQNGLTNNIFAGVLDACRKRLRSGISLYIVPDRGVGGGDILFDFPVSVYKD